MTARALLVAGALAVAGGPALAVETAPLRVCADPNNMPFSNQRGEGLENRIAEIVAESMHRDIAYTWWPERRGFLRNTLNANVCDVVMGFPFLDMVASTRAYYSSRYVLVSRADRDFTFSSLAAPELRHLTIGVHLIGDDGANTPPAEALGELGIVDNVRGYMIYGDYREESPPSRLIEAVENGDVDIAAVWGPLAGYYALHSPVPLRVVPITDTSRFLPLVFEFPIAMAVRKQNFPLRNQLNEILEKRRADIEAVLDEFGVPRDRP
jgi:mxaJ protein